MPEPVSAADLPENAPQPGDVLAGKYRVESVLGVGGMGMVLLVRHIDLGQQMAIKLMMPGVIHDDQAAARFVREARAAAAIQSEHVVRIFDVGTFDSGLPYMVMELLRGEDLSQLAARETQLPIEEAVDYVLQASHAIAEAHARGIVHRDLKPSNLFVTTRSNGTPLVKVLDFGISKALNPEVDGPSSANLTATSALMGSPLYMSPEQVRNAKHVDARTDIWALGVILHELLTGAPAFSADTLPGICAAITADDPPLLRSLREDAPAELEAVLSKCLEKNVNKRYQATKEFMAALRPFASSAGRVEPTSLPAALTMREATSEPPLAFDEASATRGGSHRSAAKPRSRAHAVKIEATPRSGGRVQGATSLASSTATLSSRETSPEGGPARGRKPVLIASAALVVAATLGALIYSGGRHEEQVPATPSAAAPAAARKSFVLFIDASPAGAEVWEGESTLGQAPMQISVDNETTRKNPRRFVVRRAGFQPYSIVQGPSEENVRITAQLVAVAGESSAMATAAATTPTPVKEHALPAAAPVKASKGTATRAEPATPVVSATAAPAA
ncbi:MAG TPA: serine/threonine-protein kinase, partial [Polyangiaceae bacterium]|nr:serine/threonine-protein kinase [Polyangiaceae bacterium]